MNMRKRTLKHPYNWTDQNLRVQKFLHLQIKYKTMETKCGILKHNLDDQNTQNKGF